MTDMSTADLLKKVSAELKTATDEFSKTADNALKEAQKAGSLSAETKNVVDELATKFNSLTEAEKALKAQLGELEQEFARIPGQTQASARDTVGGLVIKSEALKQDRKSVV